CCRGKTHRRTLRHGLWLSKRSTLRAAWRCLAAMSPRAASCVARSPTAIRRSAASSIRSGPASFASPCNSKTRAADSLSSMTAKAGCSDGITRELDDEMLPRLTRASYGDRGCGLVTLRAGKGSTLRRLGEANIDKTEARGVRVSSEGRPDVDFYFDKARGLLRKSAYRAADRADGEQVLHEMYSRDYRLVDVTAADEERLQK